MNVCHEMKYNLQYILKDGMQAQNFITLTYWNVFMDEHHPISGNISVFIVT